jgi:hypothetical protein
MMEVHMENTTKARLRHWLGEAYRRELRRELDKLHQHLDDMAAGSISEFDASHFVHIFNDSVARDLYAQYGYATRKNSEAEAIAAAVYNNVLALQELEDDVIEAISGALKVITRYRASMQFQKPNTAIRVFQTPAIQCQHLG